MIKQIPMGLSAYEKRKSVATNYTNPSPSSQFTGSTLAQEPITAMNHTMDHTMDRTSFDNASQTTSTSGLTISSNLYIEPEYDVKLILNFTQQEIKLIRSTWLHMINDDLTKNYSNETTPAQATTLNHSSIASSLFCIQFYSNLLSMDSNLEKLFPSIKHQAVSFAGVLSTAIHNLDNLKVLDDYLQNLGKRHSRILGIDPPHFELMGVALLKTFQDRFGYNFTLELERCWSRLYTYLANSILQFGIDPVLKIDKINQDWETVTLARSISNTSFDKQESVDAINRSSQRLRQPSTSTLNSSFNSNLNPHSNPSYKSPSKLDPSNKTYSIGARHMKKPVKRMSSASGPVSVSAGSEEEKCVVM